MVWRDNFASLGKPKSSSNFRTSVFRRKRAYWTRVDLRCRPWYPLGYVRPNHRRSTPRSNPPGARGKSQMIVTHTAAAHLRFTFKALPNVLPDIIWYSSDHSCYLTTPVLSKVVCGQFNCLGAICSSVSRAEPDFPAKRTSSSRLERHR